MVTESKTLQWKVFAREFELTEFSELLGVKPVYIVYDNSVDSIWAGLGFARSTRRHIEFPA